MRTRLKTALIYGFIVGLFVVPGFWHVEITATMLIVVAILAAKEMRNVLLNVNIKVNRGSLLAFNLSLLPGFLYVLTTRPELISAKKLFQDKQFFLTNNHINSELFIRLVLLYGISVLLIAGISILRPLLKYGAQELVHIIVVLTAGAYVSLPLFCGFLLLFVLPGGWLWFVIALVTPWISDSAAYFCGSLWGKKPIVPALSPKKTYVGFYGSIIGTVIFYVPLYLFLLAPLYQLPINFLSLLLVIIAAVSIGALIELGDWLASGIKRYCKIKDFSDLLPGHGGIIDRYDSTFFTFTAILSIALLIYFF